MKREEIIHTLGALEKIAEVGVLRGGYSSKLLKTKPVELHLIDPYKVYGKKTYVDHYKKTQEDWDSTHDFVVKKFSNANNVFIHRMESIEGAAMFPDGYFDLVYIDANHAYDFIINDIKAWYPKVKSGGYLAGHDIETIGVLKAACEFFGMSVEWQQNIYEESLGNLIITTEYSKETIGRKTAKSWFYKKP